MRSRSQSRIFFEKKDEMLIHKFIFYNFYFGSRAFIIEAFLTPHVSRCATTVAIVRLLSRKAGERLQHLRTIAPPLRGSRLKCFNGS